MKYLKFLSQKNLHPFGDYFQSNFSFVINDSFEKVSEFENDVIKTIEVRVTGREDASLRARYDNYELEPALFEIAKNYLLKRISDGKKIKEKEELLLDAWKYLNLETDSLNGFHTEIIQIEE